MYIGDSGSLALIALISAPRLGSGQSPPPKANRLPIAVRNSSASCVIKVVPGSVELKKYKLQVIFL